MKKAASFDVKRCWRLSGAQISISIELMQRKPSAKKVRQEKAARAVAQRKSRPVDVCTICLDAVIGPALRTAERRLGRYTPCGCEKLCWDCAYNHAMRSSLWGADNQPILNEDDLNSKIVRCPCCNSTVDAFEECSPTGTTMSVCALPFRDLSAQERCTLRSEPPSAWGRERAEPQHERSPGERAEARAAERGARRSAEQQAKHSTLVEEAEFREGVAQLVDSSGLRAALARPMQVWNMVRARAIPMPMPVPVHMPMPMPHARARAHAHAHFCRCGLLRTSL